MDGGKEGSGSRISIPIVNYLTCFCKHFGTRGYQETALESRVSFLNTSSSASYQVHLKDSSSENPWVQLSGEHFTLMSSITTVCRTAKLQHSEILLLFLRVFYLLGLLLWGAFKTAHMWWFLCCTFPELSSEGLPILSHIHCASWAHCQSWRMVQGCQASRIQSWFTLAGRSQGEWKHVFFTSFFFFLFETDQIERVGLSLFWFSLSAFLKGRTNYFSAFPGDPGDGLRRNCLKPPVANPQDVADTGYKS